MKTITCDELIIKLSVDYTSFRLLNALEPSPVMTAQIPHSLNILKEEEILLRLKKDEEIIVYCTDHICNKSIVMYYRLEGLGYKNVFRYPGGIREWVSIGQELEDISA
jgi:rhodanese-related sulfurtransferase